MTIDEKWKRKKERRKKKRKKNGRIGGGWKGGRKILPEIDQGIVNI